MSAGLGEQPTYSPVAFRCCQGTPQSAEGQGEVGPIGDHALQQILSQCRIGIAHPEEAKFARRLSALETAA